MKFLKNMLPFNTKSVQVHFIATTSGFELLVKPCDALNMRCPLCGGTKHFVTAIEPGVDNRMVWMCAERVCVAHIEAKRPKTTQHTTTTKRSLEWLGMCQICEIGDLYHSVTFESINQDSKKLEYLKKFVNTPQGIVIMTGSPGSGKTYCALGTLELFTRKSSSCMFFTHRQLANRFTAEKELVLQFTAQIKNYTLLVVEAFGS